MQRDLAETVGLKALAWLVSDERAFAAFYGATGASGADLRAGASDPVFLGAVLDFVLSEDGWTLDCAQAMQLRPEDLAEARRALPGGESVNWT